MGMQIVNSDGRTLTNLRFADDVVLMAHSRADIIKLLSDFKAEAEKYGLRLNFDKTKVMTSNHCRHACQEVKIQQNSIQILHEDEAEKYLGRKLSFNRGYHIELENCISAA